MPRPPSHSEYRSSTSRPPEASAAQETLFLLSISRDEDDAAALRADLKRSTIGNYKMQQCTNLDDGLHLMRVCGFDVVFVRLDDFKDCQTAINLICKSDNEQTIIALATSRLLGSPSFVLPEGIAATCHVEDLSPSLVSSLVQNAVHQKKEKQGRLRLERELRLALDASNLGLWKLDIESGRLILDPLAQDLMNIPANIPTLYLDDALDHVYPEDHGLFKSMITQSIEKTESINVSFRLNSDTMPLPEIEFRGQYSKGGPHEDPHLFGVLKRSDPSKDFYERITKANSEIQKASDLHEQAMAVANEELKALAQALRGPETNFTIKPLDKLPPLEVEPPPPAPLEGASPSGVGLEELEQILARSIAAKSEQATPSTESNLEINKEAVFKNILLTLEEKKRKVEDEELQDTFPFDFSANPDTDYTEPDPHNEGFVGAAKRLVSNTQKAHKLFVTLGIDEHAGIENEQEKTLLFEILKELLTNVVKHAHASECIVAVFRDEDEWVLQIEDDGTGLENNLVSISSPLNQMGLFRIRTKLALKGGQLDLTPSFPTGLIARARLPIKMIRNQRFI